MFCNLNLYELNLNFNKVYRKKLFIEENDTIASLKRKAYQHDGILFNNQEVISYKKIDSSCEELDFSLLNEYLQTQLIQLYLKKEKKLFGILNHFIPDKSFCKFEIIRELIGNVFKFDKFYLSLDIKQSIIPKYSLLEELKDYKNPKLELINKEVRPINNSNLGIIKKVIFSNDPEYKEELEMIIDYFKKQSTKINCFQKEPIIKIMFKKSKNNIAYSYLASHLKLYYSPQDINIKMTIPNSNRKQIIENAIKNSNLNYLNPQSYKTNFYKFYPVKFLGFKQVNDIKHLLVRTQENIFTIYPKKIPEILKNTNIIKTIIFIDKTINTSKNSYINVLFKGLKYIYEKTNIEFKLINKKDYFIEEFNAKNIVDKALKYKNNDNNLIPPLVITIGSKNNLDYYEDMKRLLFKYGFITQNIIYEHLLNSKNYEINNLLLQILVKYGMYPYTININHPYDYIIGIDVGNDKYGNRNIAGGISVINKEGILEKLIPIKIHTNGEKIDLSMFLEELSIHLDLKNKNILILRDGKLTKNEKESILNEFNRLSIESVTFMNVVKRHSLRIYDDNEGKKGVILKNNLALLLAHEIKGARAIKIDVKSVIKKGIIKDEYLTNEDLKLLFDLTNLNYSNLYLFSKRLRLPAPIHYSDKFVKSLGKGWKIKEDLLLNGFLYFI